MSQEKKHILWFLLITFVASFAFEAYIIQQGGIRAWPQSTLILMWIPGLVALLYRAIARIGFRDVGWKLGAGRYWLLALAVPFSIALISNVLCWTLGINQFVPNPEALLKKAGLSSVYELLFLKYPWWLLWGCINALGEELGWRGFLIPKLSYLKIKHPLLLSGLIWGVWHYPLIIWGDYATSQLPIVSVLLFTVMIACSGVFIGWLRMKSGSVWVAMFYHACHNLFLQTAFAVFSQPGKYDAYLGNESGVIPCVLYLLVLWIGSRPFGHSAQPANS